MNELVLANRAADWRRLKMLVLDSVSSPITKRVYNLGLDEFFEWFGREPRPGFTKATVSAWRVALEARGLGSISINVRITAVRKLAVEAADTFEQKRRLTRFRAVEHSVGVEIVTGRLEDNGNVDLQQRLAQRVGLLHVPNLHLAHTPLRIRKSCCEIVFTAEHYTRPFRAIRRINPASNLTS